MLKTEAQRKVVVSGLKTYTGKKVIRTNQTAEMPAFPYLGYNITTLSNENKGTYGQYEDGTARKAVLQTYSFTAHSDNYSEALELANMARQWLDYVGTQYLNDNDVIVQSVGNVTDRSNLLTSEYIYSLGFDCTFWMYDEIEGEQEGAGRIENITVNNITSTAPLEDEQLNELLEKRLSGVI